MYNFIYFIKLFDRNRIMLWLINPIEKKYDVVGECDSYYDIQISKIKRNNEDKELLRTQELCNNCIFLFLWSLVFIP